jgi:hypothetical protein
MNFALIKQRIKEKSRELALASTLIYNIEKLIYRM